MSICSVREGQSEAQGLDTLAPQKNSWIPPDSQAALPRHRTTTQNPLRLRDEGNTIIVIEHNLDVTKTADWIIGLEPEGGDKGGQVIAVGTPEAVTTNPDSWTGRYLKNYLE